MFLITTADQRFWKTDEKILFLGEWCKLYEQKSAWSKVDHQVLPYHWDDREELYRDHQYLKELNERYLSLLSSQLNEIHGIDYSIRYWRIIIGYWLFHFTAILYDRFRSVCEAAKTKKVTNTWIMAPAGARMTPRDFSSFVELFISDEYNQHLYSELIRTLGCIPFETIQVAPTEVPTNVGRSGRRIGSIAKTLFRAYDRCLRNRFSNVIFVDSSFDLGDLLRLEIALGQLPSLLSPKVATPEKPFDESLRRRLALGSGRNEFELVLDTLIPQQLPTAYLEGYDEMQRRSLCALPKNPKMILTANAYAGDEGFKFWTAHHVDRGVKLGVLQHGGHYGSGRWSATEEHEIKVSDRFYTWGWRNGDEKKTVPLPAAKLIRFQKDISPDVEGRILWVQMGMPRYSYFMYSIPVGPQMIDYLREQQIFFEFLTPPVRELVLLRLYPGKYGWNEQARWKDIDPGLQQYQGSESFRSQLKKSRLVVATYNATTFLETLSANFPTIIFWNPKHWELRPSAQPYFDELRRVGILHDTPDGAAAKVNAIYHDVLSWWRDPDIQVVRNHFCRQFARINPDWRAEWKREISSQIGSALAKQVEKRVARKPALPTE